MIAILAAITIVAYTGIQQRARVAAAQSEASQAIKKLKVWGVTNGSNLVPSDAATAGITETDSLKYYASIQPDGTGTFCIQSKRGVRCIQLPMKTRVPSRVTAVHEDSLVGGS